MIRFPITWHLPPALKLFTNGSSFNLADKPTIHHSPLLYPRLRNNPVRRARRLQDMGHSQPDAGQRHGHLPRLHRELRRRRLVGPIDGARKGIRRRAVLHLLRQRPGLAVWDRVARDDQPGDGQAVRPRVPADDGARRREAAQGCVGFAWGEGCCGGDWGVDGRDGGPRVAAGDAGYGR